MSSKYDFFYTETETSFSNIFQSETINPRTGEKFKVNYSFDKPIPPEVSCYQNLTTKTLLFNEYFGISVSIEDKMYPISWKLSKNTRKIQNIECFSAQAEYRGRVWTAWYAPSIPISSGPWLLYGLPGMILEAHDLHKTVQFICEGVTDAPKDTKIVSTSLLDNQKKDANNSNFLKNIKEIAEKEHKEIVKQDPKMAKSPCINTIEIFDFEKDMEIKRFQQKLSDIPKK